MKPCKRCGAPIEGKILRKRVVHCQSCSEQLAGTKNRRHGQSETREYAAWTAMRERCRNPNAHNYSMYGARGIRVCERWDTSFENFLADMGPRPKGYSIEREDNEGNYEPANCKWIPMSEQSRNRRGTYTAEEDQKIREAVALKYSFPEMAAHVGKSQSSVMGRTYRLGLRSGRPPTRASYRVSSQHGVSK